MAHIVMDQVDVRQPKSSERVKSEDEKDIGKSISRYTLDQRLSKENWRKWRGTAPARCNQYWRIPPLYLS